jgi:hypothetical protein
MAMTTRTEPRPDLAAAGESLPAPASLRTPPALALVVRVPFRLAHSSAGTTAVALVLSLEQQH